MKYKLHVDRDCCIGCSACIAAAPELFELDEEGKSRPVQEIIDETKLESANLARDSCPGQCIKIEKIE